MSDLEVASIAPIRSSRLLLLNDDVVAHILAYLPIKELLTVRLGSKRLRHVCDGDGLWSGLCCVGNIAPLSPLTWRALGQRLSCHKWCYALSLRDGTRIAGGETANAGLDLGQDAEDADSSSQSTAEATRTQHRGDVPTSAASSPPVHAAPVGEWIRVVQTGLRYESFPNPIIPFVETVASSRPLSNHKGNNTASIGLIPIGLTRPHRAVKCGDGATMGEENEEEEEREAAPPSSTDPAIALHRKLFSAMGVEYTGDWEALCRVMRPHGEGDDAKGSQPSARMSPTSTPTAPSAVAGGGGGSAPSIATDASTPSLHVLDVMPHLGARRVMATCLSPGSAADHPNATARLVEALFNTCSTIVFAAPDATHLRDWLDVVSPHMTIAASPSPFSTADNTPNIVFMTTEQIPSLREVLVSPTFEGTAQSSSTVIHRRSPKEAFSWILNRSSCVGEIVFSDTACPLSLKTYYAPAWVAPECSLPLPSPAIARMLLAVGEANGEVGCSLWTRDVAKAICQGHAAQCTSFYEEAMRTEISEANRPAIAFTNLPVPMDPSEIVSIQDHFFYAALRSYAMAVRHACGSDSALGIMLLEEFKKDISTAFRALWSQNIATSRAYCTVLFDNVFHAVHDRYNGESGANGFQDKRALHQWFSAVTDKISEYIIKAKGPRKMDVLSERIVMHTIGGLQRFCMQHPEHPYVRIEDVNLAAAEISAYCTQLITGYHGEQDEILSVKQRNSAMYTACLGTMWAGEAIGEAIKYLTMQSQEYDTWAELLQLKREGFGLAPSAVLSLTVANPHPAPSLHDATTAYTPSGGESSGFATESETNSVSESLSSVFGSSSVGGGGNGSRSRASSSRPEGVSMSDSAAPTAASIVASPTLAGGQSSSERVRSIFSSIWSGIGGGGGATSSTTAANNHASTAAHSGGGLSSSVAMEAPPRQRQTASSRLARLSSTLRESAEERRRRRKHESAVKKGECVVFTELEYERQAMLQDLVRKQAEQKQRMESVGKTFNLGSDMTSDFNVIQRQFSHGFKDYRAARRVEDAADEIASRLRTMRERVRSSFASTRDRQ